MLRLVPEQHIHLIGIGGAGLSAIARILLERGFPVSGSDLNANALTAALAADGARVYHGHHADHVRGANLILASSAVPVQHVEIISAQAHGIPIYNRREFMSALVGGHQCIAVAGTHGKTTTTSMLVHMLQQAGKDPSYIVGGTMGNTGRNAGVGQGEYFVIEADEYDNMFHGLRPHFAIVTNVEHDHPDFFQTPEQLQLAFQQFVALLPSDGILVACADDAAAASLANDRCNRGMEAVSYGINKHNAKWRATNLQQSDGKTIVTVVRDGAELGALHLTVPGTHNVLNALAALIVADACGVTFAAGTSALESFRNTARRFDIRGIRDDVIVVDDYAHHPTEIRVNLRAARERYPHHQIWAIWQPHTYSRVQEFWSGFVSAFDCADHVLLTPIYAAREAPVEGITSQRLVSEMGEHPSVRYVPSFEDAVMRLQEDIKGAAVVLICSAGDANQIAELFLDSSETAR